MRQVKIVLEGWERAWAWAKSALRVKSSLSFMDIIVCQAHYLNDRMPVLFMKSFSTRADTMALFEQYSELRSDIPNDFLQHNIPKVNAEDLRPAAWTENPHLEWCPPGLPGGQTEHRSGQRIL